MSASTRRRSNTSPTQRALAALTVVGEQLRRTSYFKLSLASRVLLATTLVDDALQTIAVRDEINEAQSAYDQLVSERWCAMSGGGGVAVEVR